jgi:NAD(P)-dependent dehydrogenase (short-subunit alcohol dehydrogenase family)
MERTFPGNPEREAQKVANIPLGRLGSAEELADAIVWLASPSSSYVSGSILVADGGLSA